MTHKTGKINFINSGAGVHIISTAPELIKLIIAVLCVKDDGSFTLL